MRDLPRMMTPTTLQLHPSYRPLLRGLAVLVAAGLVILWALFVRNVFLMSDLRPAPAAFMFPILFFTFAISGGVAALRDEPIRIIIEGGLSLFPAGLLLAFIPGPSRWIAVLDLLLLVAGILLLRSEKEFEG